MTPLLILGGAAIAGGVYYFFIRPKSQAQGGYGTPGATLTPLPPGSPGLTNLQVGFVEPGRIYTVATHDTGPTGQLTVRSTPGGAIIGSVPHGSTVEDAGGYDGTHKWLKVTGADSNTGETITGWVAAEYLQ
jgi:hypothetical protein